MSEYRTEIWMRNGTMKHSFYNMGKAKGYKKLSVEYKGVYRNAMYDPSLGNIFTELET